MGPLSRRYRWLVPVVLVVAGLAAFGSALNNPLLFDDDSAITGNPSIRTLWPIHQALWAPRNNPLAGRPVVNLSFALNYAAGGAGHFGYHAVNLFFHVLNAWLLFSVVRRTLHMPALGQRFVDQAVQISLTAAVLWMIHPLQTEVINYVTQRTEILMGTFYLLTLYTAIRAWERPTIWIPACALSCTLGMLSKESMVTAPVVVVLYDVAFASQPWRAIWHERRTLYLSLAATWVVLAVIMVNGPRSDTVGFGLGMTVGEYALSQLWAISRYARLVFWPCDLLVDYGPVPHTSVRDIFPGAIVVVICVGMACWLWPRNRPASFALIAAILILAPTSSIVPIATEIGAERRMYVPLAPVLALLVCAFRSGVNVLVRNSITEPAAIRLKIAIGMGVVVLLGLRSWVRNQEYEDPVELWRNATRIVPDNYRAYGNLRFELARAGRDEEAYDVSRRAAELADADPDYLCNVAASLCDMHRFAEAAEIAERIVSSHGDHARSFAVLSRALLPLGRRDEALAAASRSVALKPESSSWLALHHVLLATGQTAEAVKAAENAVQLQPDSSAGWLALSRGLRRAGRVAEASQAARRAMEIDPRNVPVVLAVAQILGSAGELTEAFACIDRAVEIEPNSADVWFVRGNLFRADGKSDQAIECYRYSLTIEPRYADAHNNLGAMLTDSNPRAAIEHLQAAVEANPQHENAHVNLGNAFLQLQRFDEAMQSFENALRCNPNNERAQQSLQLLRQRQQK